MIWFPAKGKPTNQKPQTYLYCHRLDYKLYLPSIDLNSKFTGVVKSAKNAESDDLVWPNRKLVADERPQKRDSRHHSGRLDPRSCSKCYCDNISSSDGASEPCSHSIKNAEILIFEERKENESASSLTNKRTLSTVHGKRCARKC